MATKTEIKIGALILVILTSTFYIMWPENVRIDFEDTRTVFKVYEDDRFVISGREYVRVFDGSTKMLAKYRGKAFYPYGNETRVYKVAIMQRDKISIRQYYTFINNPDNVEQVPVSEKVCFSNATGKIFEWLIQDITYEGETKEITSPFSFGKKMKVTFQDGYYRAKVYQNKYAADKIIVRYRITEDDQCFDVKLFDPPENNIQIKNISKEWVPQYSNENEQNFNFWIENKRDKKSHLCWILKEGINPIDVDLTDKFLYNQEGEKILDDKNKSIKLKWESSKCNGKDGYSIALTDTQALNIDSYIKLGANSYLVEYTDVMIIEYNFDDLQINTTLLKNVSGEYVPSPNDIFINQVSNVKIKFGAYDNVSKERTSYKYLFDSNKEIEKVNNLTYRVYKNTIPGRMRIYDKHLYQYIYLDDICYNQTCLFNHSQNNLHVTFYADYNITTDLIEIDPTFENVNVSDFYNWWNFSDNSTGQWIDEAGNNNYDDKDSFLSSRNTCINGDCLEYNNGAQNPEFEGPMIGNSTFVIQINFLKEIYTGWDNPYIGGPLSLRFDGTGEDLKCAVEQSTGDQYVFSPIIRDGDDWGIYDSLIIFCMVNETHVCGAFNNSAYSCSTRNGKLIVGQYQKIGQSGGEPINLTTSGLAIWQRPLNDSERQEVYDCLSTRGNLAEGCAEEPADTTPPTFTAPIPQNQSLQENITFVMQINATDETALDTFAVNDTGNFSINSTGYLINATHLSVGMYQLNITVNDTTDNKASTYFWVNITKPAAVNATPAVSVSLVTPSVNGNVTQNEFFEFTVETCCNVGTCGVVNVTLDPEIQANGTEDIYTFNSSVFNEYCGFFKINMSQVDESPTLALLHFYIQSNTSYVSNSNVSKITDYWNESSTAAVLGALSTSSHSTQTSGLGESQWHNFTVTSIVQACYSAGETENCSIRLSGGVSGCDDADTIGSTGNVIRFQDSTLTGTHYLQIADRNNITAWHVNITYPEDSTKSGIISTTAGTTPFYTNASGNPLQTSSLSSGSCENTTFYVNATGTVSTTHEFHAYVNISSNYSISNLTSKINLTIVAAAATSDCTCPASGNLLIDDGCIFNITTTCDLGANRFDVIDGGIRIYSGGALYSAGGYIKYGEVFYVDSAGKFRCP